MSMASQTAAGLPPASGSSFYAAMRILPRARRDAMLAIYGFCRAVDDIADEPSEDPAIRLQSLDAWRRDLMATYSGGSQGCAAALAAPIKEFDLELADFVAVIDGMEMDVRENICAPSSATLDLYCDRVASAVGRLSVRVFGVDRKPGIALAHHLGRALQLTNILRDLDEDAAIGRLYLPREALDKAGIRSHAPAEALADPKIDLACSSVADSARRHFREASLIMAGGPRAAVRCPRVMAEVYESILDRMSARGWSQPRVRVRTPKHRVLLAILRHGLF